MNKNHSEDMSNLTTYYTSALMKIQTDNHSNLLNLIGQQKTHLAKAHQDN